MNVVRVLIVLIFIGVVGWLAYQTYQTYLAPVPQPALETSEAPQPLEPLDVVSAEGRVVPGGESSLAFAQAGRVVEVLVREGERVETGQTLARLEMDGLQAALEQAEAGLRTAQANVIAAEIGLELARQAAHAAGQPARESDWRTSLPPEIEQPAWYFDRTQEMDSVEAELEAARADLEAERTRLESVLADASSEDVAAAEERLARAQTAFLVARQVLDRANTPGDQELRSEAERRLDLAESELEAAQDAHEDVLTTEAAEDVLEARARLAVAQERYDSALDRRNALRMGEESLEVRQAAAALDQARAALEQAEAAARAAQVALQEAELLAPFPGLVARLDLAVGEVSAPGQEAILIADDATWQVETTDLSEIDVALIVPGMPAEISLDAFPNQTFEGQVREVGLVGEDSRGSIIYTVWIDFDPNGEPVRWGMTAFADIHLR